jgi:transposase-like protein
METSTDTASSAAESGTSDNNSSDGTAGTRRKLSDQQEAEVTRLYAETDTPVSEISKRFGIGESSVYRVAQRHGAALRGRTATSGTSKPRATASAAAATPVAATRTPGRRGPGRASAGRAAAVPSGNGRRTGGTRAPRAVAPTRRSGTPAASATPAAAPRAASGTSRSFRVSYVAERVFTAVDMNDAIRQAEAAGATDITGVVRND